MHNVVLKMSQVNTISVAFSAIIECSYLSLVGIRNLKAQKKWLPKGLTRFTLKAKQCSGWRRE